MIQMIYRERSGGQWHYWTYSDSERVFVSERWALREMRLKRARLVSA